MTEEQDPLDGGRLMERIAALRAISETEGAYTRRYLTPEHRRAADLVAEWMRAAGLEVREDAVGNVTGRLAGADDAAPALLLGSHIDSVRDAGSFDGPLGVISAIAVAEALARRDDKPSFPIEVIAFGDEEGLRFQSSLLTSRALVAPLSGDVLDRVGEDGETLRAAMRSYGLDPDKAGDAVRAPGSLRAYLELHIEQGPVLEAEELPVGVVSAIVGQAQLDVVVTGTAGHAGTLPMGKRQDALAAAAEAILAIERLPRDFPDAVATVGRLSVTPGASNVVAGEVRFTIDTRSPLDTDKEQIIAAIDAVLAAVGDKRGVTITTTLLGDNPATPCDDQLENALSAAAMAVVGRSRTLVSGAGHDAMALAEICPVGMLFVRCKDGISHNPAESVTPEDAETGTRVLLAAVERLAGSKASGPADSPG